MWLDRILLKMKYVCFCCLLLSNTFFLFPSESINNNVSLASAAAHGAVSQQSPTQTASSPLQDYVQAKLSCGYIIHTNHKAEWRQTCYDSSGKAPPPPDVSSLLWPTSRLRPLLVASPPSALHVNNSISPAVQGSGQKTHTEKDVLLCQTWEAAKQEKKEKRKQDRWASALSALCVELVGIGVSWNNQ